MNMSTEKTPAVTAAQIKALSAEAAQAGDRAMIDTCFKALGGNKRARRVCERVITAALAEFNDGEE
jgi:hypothetical protein